jgi:hypothetical protein
MARTIQSPGVEIQEVDLSLRQVPSGTTSVLIPGFAPKGPVAETISVASLSEFEQIYGTPTNAAERYFYHTVKATFQSPSDVIVYRLPYGESLGINTTDNYTALVYPVVAYYPGTSSANATSYVPVTGTTANANTYLGGASATYLFGAPTHIQLTQEQYLGILRGDAFTWTSQTSATNNTGGINTAFSTINDLGKAGLIVLNKGQTSINNKFEGYYVGVIDNTNLNPATLFDDVNRVLSLNTTATTVSGNSYVRLPDTRLAFPLSAGQSGTGSSVSEALENIPTFDIYTNEFDDTAVFGVFKLRQSVFAPDTIALDYVLEESYVASFDAYRQINNVNGGPAQSFFIETLDNNSTQITTLINPFISNKLTNSWLNDQGIPTKKVRFLSNHLVTPIAGETPTTYETRVGAPSAVVASFNSSLGTTDALVALGDYTPQDINTKTIGNVPAKLQSLFDKTENSDIYPFNIVVEGGLGTIYVNSFNPKTSGYFDDTVAYSAIQAGLTAQTAGGTSSIQNSYNAVASQFVTFAQNQRKDLIYIADPITNIFVEGQNIKTLDDPTKSFNSNIYWPLRNQFASIDTSYACAYANVVKVADIASAQEVWVPFSGFAAALMGNTDSNFQPWFAPAGFTRGIVTGITDLGLFPKQKQRDLLYKINLNPVAFFPGEGFVVYGQKTLQRKPSAFDRINVRRLFINLETATKNTVKYFVFEPNTLFTRTQVINTLTPIFDNAKNTQGIYDYLLICDERNNTADIIDQNTLIIDVYLKPTRAAEFILANFYATRTGVSFQEIVS